MLRWLVPGDSRPMCTQLENRRFIGVDCWRGLAVVFMAVDHACWFFGVFPWVRSIGTRPGIILWSVVAGVMSSGRHISQLYLFIGCGLSAMAAVLPTGCPDTVLLLTLGSWFAARYPVASVPLALLACVQLASWPIPRPWTGYQPGLIFALITMGRLWLDRHQLDRLWPLGTTTRTTTALAWLGRHSLALYVGHLLVLSALVALDLQKT